MAQKVEVLIYDLLVGGLLGVVLSIGGALGVFILLFGYDTGLRDWSICTSALWSVLSTTSSDMMHSGTMFGIVACIMWLYLIGFGIFAPIMDLDRGRKNDNFRGKE